MAINHTNGRRCLRAAPRAHRRARAAGSNKEHEEQADPCEGEFPSLFTATCLRVDHDGSPAVGASVVPRAPGSQPHHWPLDTAVDGGHSRCGCGPGRGRLEHRPAALGPVRSFARLAGRRHLGLGRGAHNGRDRDARHVSGSDRSRPRRTSTASRVHRATRLATLRCRCDRAVGGRRAMARPHSPGRRVRHVDRRLRSRRRSSGRRSIGCRGRLVAELRGRVG
jgi:hypothetical protein